MSRFLTIAALLSICSCSTPDSLPQPSSESGICITVDSLDWNEVEVPY